jgi:hypothetical protein
MPGTALSPRWCPPRLTPRQKRRIQRLRAQKLREEETEKERDEHFNTIRSMFPTKQEWRVKEKAGTLPLTTSDGNMDLLDDDESLLIKDGSPPLTRMDINIVFTLPAEFRDAEEEFTQMCLSPKEAVFEKPEESSQHIKPWYVRGQINERSISRMLIDSGAAINSKSYSVFKKLRREEDELVKTNVTLNDVGGNPMEAKGVISMELAIGSKLLATAFFIVEV